MSNIAIRVADLGKMYRIGGPQEKYKTLRDTISDMATAPFRRVRDLMQGQVYGASGLKEEIWALKDVSFEVQHGEAVGIIGRNGAGKSTLLKILSRITEPTKGHADIYGRVGALLEVGTGFHPELTGRENVYLNGAILGMSRRDIDRKFDEIVDFAGVERFIDTPVKHYSSGMGLRLGFAVAAHLEPEILVIDEVLAVGDVEFQKRCLGKMSQVAGEGRTVLFVSHNMDAVKRLCPRAVILEAGRLISDGNSASTINQYLNAQELGTNIAEYPIDANKDAQFVRVAAIGADNTTGIFRHDEEVHIELTLFFQKSIQSCMIMVAVYNADGIAAFTTTDWDANPDRRYQRRGPGFEHYMIKLPAGFLFPGRYSLRLGLGISGQYLYDKKPSSIEFEVSYDGSLIAEFSDKRRGVVTPVLAWELSKP